MTSEMYVITARTERSSMSVGTHDPVDALKRAREMVGSRSLVVLTDCKGNNYTVDEFDEAITAGAFLELAAT